MTIQKIEVFQATDGTRYDTEAEARLHDRREELREWYNSNDNHLSADYSRLDFDEVVKWLTDNHATIRTILQIFG